MGAVEIETKFTAEKVILTTKVAQALILLLYSESDELNLGDIQEKAIAPFSCIISALKLLCDSNIQILER